ncbi:MAG: thiamine-phosphate kinase [Thiotrichales bacterium]
MAAEFELIERYFRSLTPYDDGVLLGIGDDAAVVRLPPRQVLAVTVDTLAEGVHFPIDTAAEHLGHKALAVNLSDLAAMGAMPRWFTLALTLPRADEQWLQGFAAGLARLANRHRVALIGGDTTRGPLSITIQALGILPDYAAATRAGAHPDDDIYVTGTLGDAALGLAAVSGKTDLTAADAAYCAARLNTPTPRVMAGLALQGYATSMIDCSDGFAADLGHILTQSGVGAELRIDRLPLSGALRRQPVTDAWRYALTGGDDYELIFTAPAARRGDIAALVDALDCPLTWVGRIREAPGPLWRDAAGQTVTPETDGYQHFA